LDKDKNLSYHRFISNSNYELIPLQDLIPKLIFSYWSGMQFDKYHLLSRKNKVYFK